MKKCISMLLSLVLLVSLAACGHSGAAAQTTAASEPESALDFRFRHRMLELLRSWIREKQVGALVTLHDPMLALNYCDKLLLLSGGTLIGELRPREQSLEAMEAMLARIYGTVTLRRCQNRSGQETLVMLMEEQP